MNLDMAQVLEDIAKDPRCSCYDETLLGMAKIWRKMEAENRELKQQLSDAKSDFRSIRRMLETLKEDLETAKSKKEHDA